MKGSTMITDPQDERYDPLPVARFLALPYDILSIIYLLGTKVRNSHQGIRGCRFTAEEEELKQKVAKFIHEKIFDDVLHRRRERRDEDNHKKEETKEYFFKLSSMSPKDVAIHLVLPVTSGSDVAHRLISR